MAKYAVICCAGDHIEFAERLGKTRGKRLNVGKTCELLAFHVERFLTSRGFDATVAVLGWRGETVAKGGPFPEEVALTADWAPIWFKETREGSGDLVAAVYEGDWS